MRTKNELKSALAAIDVKKPLRLPFAPRFSAPLECGEISRSSDHTQDAKPTLVENSAKVPVSTGDSHATSDVTLSGAELSTQAPIPSWGGKSAPVVADTSGAVTPGVVSLSPVEKIAGVLVPTLAPKSSPVANDTEVAGIAEARGPLVLPRRSCEQDSSVVLEAKSLDGLERGFTRLPNCVLMRLIGGEFTRNEIRIALLIARFTISYRRRHAPLSKTVIERRTGVQGSSVLEALAGLQSKGLVEKIQGDQNKPNLLGLVLPSDWDDFVTPNKHAATPAKGKTSAQDPTEVGNQPKVTKAPATRDEEPTEYKDNYKNINTSKNSLSQFSKEIRDYFEQLKPKKKRESEWESFQSLLCDFSSKEISECLLFLRRDGVGQLGQVCHSPMAYLSKAMTEILGKVNRQRKLEHAEQDRARIEAEDQEKKNLDEAREATEWAQKELAFIQAFPEEHQQIEILSQLCQKTPFSPKSQAGKMIAIGLWWNGLGKQNLSQ